MRVMPHILLAFLAIGLQRGLGPLLTVGAARLDLVMIAAAFSATCFPRVTGPLVALAIGLAYDFAGAGPIGLHAVAFGVAGLIASNVPTNRWGRLLATLVASIVVASMLFWVLGLLRWGFNDDPSPAGHGFLGMLGTILLTGLFAVALSLPLWKWRRVFLVEDNRF